MTRGKHGAQAANRAARQDNEIINDLRKELAVVAGDRDRARQEVQDLRRDKEVEIARRAASEAQERIAALREQLDAERAARQADREAHFEGVALILRNTQSTVPLRGWQMLAHLFQMSGRLPELVDDLRIPTELPMHQLRGNRELRRRDDKKLRNVDRISGAINDVAGAGAKAAFFAANATPSEESL